MLDMRIADLRKTGTRLYATGLLCCVLIGIAGPAIAELLNKPVYYPHTKSYFELVHIGTGYSIRGPDVSEILWQRAADFAAAKTFKGTRGRLAVVKDYNTHKFLLDTFKPKYGPWIGLRYFCEYNKLLWVTGEEHPLNGFAYWASPWKSRFACKGAVSKYAGVHIVRPGERGAWRWSAQASDKEQDQLFIEYPTGGP